MNLFIDTHLTDVVIILAEDGKIKREKILKDVPESSKVIMPTIKKVLANDKLDSIIVVNGPGSFTGVRLGVTIAKTLAYTMNKPIRTITSLECLALSTNADEKIVAFSDKNGYYIGIFDDEYNLVGNYEYLSNSEYEEYKQNHNVLTNIKLDYNKIIAYALTTRKLNPHEVNPIYVKKIAVERQ